ncbi:MAG: hypothetical protein ACRCU9_11910 [Iodobacter sp.]
MTTFVANYIPARFIKQCVREAELVRNGREIELRGNIESELRSVHQDVSTLRNRIFIEHNKQKRLSEEQLKFIKFDNFKTREPRAKGNIPLRCKTYSKGVYKLKSSEGVLNNLLHKARYKKEMQAAAVFFDIGVKKGKVTLNEVMAEKKYDDKTFLGLARNLSDSSVKNEGYRSRIVELDMKISDLNRQLKMFK